MLGDSVDSGLDISSPLRMPRIPIDIPSFRVKSPIRDLQLDDSARSLATAILLQALRDVLQVCTRGTAKESSRWKEDALEWFYSEADYPGSLRWVSRIVVIDIDCLRAWLKFYSSRDETEQREMARKIRRVYLSSPSRRSSS
jgi:hypothetical protein